MTKPKPPKEPGPKDSPKVREAQPSAIDVRDSWIEVTDPRMRYPSVIGRPPSVRPPAITLPDDALMIDDGDASFPDYEAPTLPNARAFRPLLGSTDEAALLRELAGPPPQLREEEKPKRRPSRPPRRTTTSPPARRVQDLDLASVRAFEDLTAEMQQVLLDDAVEKRIGATTTVAEIDTLLVVKGAVRVDVSRGDGFGGIWHGLLLHQGDVLTRRRGIDGLGDPIVLGGEPGTTVLWWGEETIDRVLALCPWIDDSLRDEGERLQTLLLLATKQRRGVWREMMRLSRLTRLEGRSLLPGQVALERGEPVSALVTVGFGTLDLVDEVRAAGHCDTGDILFPSCVLGALPAPARAKAGPSGATLIEVETSVVKVALGELPLLGRRLRAAS